MYIPVHVHLFTQAVVYPGHVQEHGGGWVWCVCISNLMEYVTLLSKLNSNASPQTVDLIFWFSTFLPATGILVFYCCIANCHKLYGFKQLRCITLLFAWATVWAQFNGVLSSGSPQAALKVSAWAGVSSESQDSVSPGCWQNSIPCSCKKHGHCISKAKRSMPLGRFATF